MRTCFSTFEQYSIAEAEIAETEILGSGGVFAPSFWVAVRLDVSPQFLKPNQGLEIVSLSGEISIDSGPRLVAEQVRIGFLMPKEYDGFKGQHHYLKFPLNSLHVVALEQIRAGGNLKFRIDVRLVVHKLQALNPTSPPNHMVGQVWGYVRPQQLQLQTELTIPRDTWISRVLNNIGYGHIHIIELPAVPLAACLSMEQAFKALQQAQEFHKIGHYDEAVGKCRVALDKFFGREDKTGADGKTRSVPVLEKSWETKLGAATYEWLDKSLGAIKQVANKPHHSPNAHYDQFESQMIIAITTTLVAYAARTTGTEN